MINLYASIICLMLAIWSTYMMRIAIEKRDVSLTICWGGCIIFFALFTILWGRLPA